VEPQWLDEDEMAAWLPLVRLLTALPQSLDTQLREEAGISHLYYQVLVMLSASPDGALRMTEIARTTGMSLSRLSRAVASLEERGWVERRPCPDDRRGQVAHLLPPGRRALEAAAPGHVAEVRRRVFDHLSPEQVRQLRGIAEQLLAAAPEPSERRTGAASAPTGTPAAP
jgi:DNA-binding MarR family transcriptional regulator